jgi:PadR family transcriptional regulator, regulatory protein PadR
VPPDALGDLELLVVLAVLRCGEQAYAVPVRDEIAARAGRDVSRGAVHVTLDRLERKGWLRSHLGDPTPTRGGRAKRLYAVTRAGRTVLAATLAGTRAMLDGLPPQLDLERPG